MLYIRVNGEWYSTKYKKQSQLKIEEAGQARVVYDSDSDKIISQLVMTDNTFIDEMSEAQIRLELFLQGGQFRRWSMEKN